MTSPAELLDTYGIPHATLKLRHDGSGSVCGVSLESCNQAFCDQTSVFSDAGDDFVQVAFGIGSPEAIARFADAVEGTRTFFPLFFRSASRWFSCFSVASPDQILSLVLVDVTSYRTDSALVQLREQAYRSFIEHLQMIAFLQVVGPEPVTLFAAGSFREITGYGPEQGTTASAWLEIVHPEDLERVQAESRLLRSDPDYEDELEYRIVRRDGRVRWVRSYDRHFTSDDGSMQLIQGLIMDVTERKHQEEALREAHDRIQEQNRLLARLARTDALTGLLNRRAMQEQLERELRLYNRGRPPFSVLMIDLDDFKAVNDRYGHRAGDRVLIHLAETLSAQLRTSDVQSRWGGEEFMVLFSGTDANSARSVSQKLLATFAGNPATVDGKPIPVTFTGGLVEALPDDSVDSLFARADAALYQGKNAGRNQIVLVASS